MSGIPIDDILPLLTKELSACEYGEVTLELSVHNGSIVRFKVGHTYSSRVVQVPIASNMNPRPIAIDESDKPDVDLKPT